MNHLSIILFLITIVFSQNNMTPPAIPEILGVADDGSVTITWNRAAESSIDEKTGYADFEGYRLYRSTDGGLTWGDIETDIIPQNGEIVGWRPIRQFDLNEDQDLERCVYSNAYDDCDDDPETEGIDESLMRSISISGADPVAPWFYLGDNTSLNHSFTDTDVINGIEYTYAITAYDMGVKIDTVVINNTDGQITLDTTWNISNPGQFACPEGWGLEDVYNQCPSFESPKLSESFTDYNSNGAWDEGEPFEDIPDGIYNEECDSFSDCGSDGICLGDEGYEGADDDGTEGNETYDLGEPFIDTGNCQFDLIRDNLINIVTVTPSKNASDISFPDASNTDDFILANENNSGTGNTTYRLVDEQALEPAMIKIEIQADNDHDNDDGLSDNDGDFEDYSTRNPSVYVYRVNEDDSLYDGYYAQYENNTNNAYLLDLPGAILSDEDEILVPTYLIENHPIMFSNIDGSENNFTDWFYGVQFRLDNYWSELPQTNSFATLDTVEFYNSENQYNENLETTFSPIRYADWGGFEIPSGDITLEFWNEGFSNRAMFDYKIEFHTTEHVDTAFRNFPNDDYCLDVSVGNSDWDGRDQVSFLPLKITNLTTGRHVRVWHSDDGIYDAEDPPQGLDGITQSDVPGYTDCVWQPNEILSFAYDSLAYGEDLDDIDDHKTYQLRLQYDLSSVRAKYGQGLVLGEEGFPYYELFDFWEAGNYEVGDRVEVLRIINLSCEFVSTGIVGIYEAKRDIIDSLETYPNFCNGTCSPNIVYDNDGDNLNDSPWKQLYPWDDGDYVIVTPDKWFNDGDSWKVDLSRLGQKEELTSEMLDSVLVIPNPYVVGSQYNEEVYGNRLLFDKLPKECVITIYTVKGELVDILEHGGDNNLDGSMPWDLKNQNGDLVHPGLYFYTVEATGVKNKIGKFVIIR